MTLALPPHLAVCKDGKQCFRGAQVPVAALFDYLATGNQVFGFVELNPTVSIDQVREVLLTLAFLSEQ